MSRCWSPSLTAIGSALVVLAAAHLGCRPPAAEPPSTARDAWSERLEEEGIERLNVILITVDTLRADRLSCYGSRRVSTPNIDRLAQEGVRFANAATTVPFTLPAHSSLMTGTYPPSHGVRENVGYVLDESLPTLAERMRAGGWATAGFVSAFVLDSRWGIGRGFDTYFDDFDLGESQTANLGSVQRDGSETVAEAVRWLDTAPPEPFFLWLHLFDPHDPYTPPEPFKSRFPRHPYDAEVAYADSLIGEFRAALEERKLLAGSLLVFTGDHGEGLGQHREGFHGFFIYDSTVHVPLIVRMPVASLAGRVVDEAVSHVDIVPTILEATGQELPEHLQGLSLLSLLLDQPSDGAPRRSVYTESLYPLLHYGWAPLRSLRTSQFKFIDAPRPELYDHRLDPQEQSNVLLDHRRISRELKDSLDGLVERIESPDRRNQQADLDDESLRQLQALGYVAGRGGVTLDELDDRSRADPKDRIELHQIVMSAQSDIGAGDFDTAEGKLVGALETDSELLDAHQMLGTISSQRQQFEPAAGHFQAALELQPDHPPALWGLANAYRRLERPEDALAGYRRLLELDPGDTKAAIAAVDLLVERGDRPAAISVLESAAADERPAPIVLSRLGELLALESRSEEAEELFRQAMAGNEELVPPRFNLAVLMEDGGRLDEAIVLYEETIERAPGHYQAMFNLGRILGSRGAIERQQELYERAIEANPDFVRGYYFLAKLIMDRGGDLARAEALIREALAKDPEGRAGPLGYFVLADILNRQGRTAEARQAVDRGRSLQPGEGP